MNAKHDKRTKQHKQAKRPSPSRPRARTWANTNVGRKPAVRKNKPAHDGWASRKPPSLTRQRVKEAQDFAKDENLLDRYIEIVQQRVAGEEQIIRACILVAAGRLVANPENDASFNLCLESASSAGKSFVIKSFAHTLPTSLRIQVGKASPTALGYLFRNDSEFTWDGKLLCLNDIPCSTLNSDTTKVFLSGEIEEQAITKDGQSSLEHLNGKPAVIMSTTNAGLRSENIRRVSIIKLDESEEQTGRILHRIAERKAGKASKTDDFELLQAFNVLLKRVPVVVPWIEKCEKYFEGASMRVRTDFGRFGDYIAASAAFHQYQRRKDSAGRIIANARDYSIARRVFRSLRVISETTYSLSGPAKDLMAELREGTPDVNTKIDGKPVVGFTQGALAALTNRDTSLVSRTLKWLFDKEFVVYTRKPNPFGPPTQVWQHNDRTVRYNLPTEFIQLFEDTHEFLGIVKQVK